MYRSMMEDGAPLDEVMKMISDDLSEPYSIFTFRYFLTKWPELCLYSEREGRPSAAVLCKMERESGKMVGYIAMLVVRPEFRRLGIATKIIEEAVRRMRDAGCEAVVLEAEVTNQVALKLYGRLGFMRESRLFKYYFNGTDAYKLALPLV